MTTTRYSDSVVRHAIGFDSLLKFAEIAGNSTYPPHNIMRITTGKGEQYRLTLAVSGFTKEDLVVAHQDDILHISGARTPQDDIATNDEDVHVHIDGRPVIEYLHRGIAFREFSRQFKIGRDVEILGATLEHGLLQIDLRRIIPEAEKPKIVEIR